jgi:hypothetical protein
VFFRDGAAEDGAAPSQRPQQRAGSTY